MAIGFLAGQLPSAADFLAVVPVGVRKSLDETIISNAVLQNDDELFAPMVANATYWAHLHLVYSSGTTPDLQYDFTRPSGSTFGSDWSILGITTAGTFNYGLVGPGPISIGGTGGDTTMDTWGTIVVAATPGNLQVRWAQNTSTASNSTVRAGSALVLIRIS